MSRFHERLELLIRVRQAASRLRPIPTECTTAFDAVAMSRFLTWVEWIASGVDGLRKENQEMRELLEEVYGPGELKEGKWVTA